MTELEFLEVLEAVPGEYLLEAQALRRVKTHRRPRIWLLAAAVLLLLAGCVAGVLGLRQYSVGSEAYTKKFDDNGLAIPPEVHQFDVIPGHGHAGEPVYEAQKEWMEFTGSYEGGPIPNETDLADIPNSYEYIYGCYTPEMSEKLEEIAEKYTLQLLEEAIPIQRWQWDVFWEALGIRDILKPGTDAEMTGLQGMYYAPGNFDLSLDLQLDGEVYPIHLSYSRKDFLPQTGYWLLDLEGVREWEIDSNGLPLLLAEDSQGNGFVLADRGEDLYFLEIRNIAPQQLESLAGLFDFRVSPREIDLEFLNPLLEEAERAHQEQLEARTRTEGSFADALRKDVGFQTAAQSYVFRDLNGDGKEELLILRDGSLVRWYQEEDGVVVSFSEPLEVDIPGDNLLPLTDYPLEKGTLGDYLQQADAPVPPEEIREIYREVLRTLDRNHYTHYGLADVNGDGVEDLLLSGDGERYWSAYTYRFGKLQTLFWADFLLCDDGVLEMKRTVYEKSGRVLDVYRYVTISEDGQTQRLLSQAVYDRSTASWLDDVDGAPLPNPQAERYSLIDQEMKPIS